MYPTITLGSLTLNTYPAVYTLMFIIGGMFMFYRLRHGGMPARVYERDLLLFLFGIGVCTYGPSLVETVIWFIRTGRFEPAVHTSFFGTLLGIVLAGWLVFRKDAPGQLGRVADLLGLPLPLLQAIGRIACMGAGCCYGAHTDSWLGIYLRNSEGEWALRYPTQIMSGVINLLVFVTLIVVERYGLRRARETGQEGERIWPFDGFVFLLYCNLFCVERFAMEFLRGDATPILGAFSGTHFATLAGWLVTAGLIGLRSHDSFTRQTRANMS